MIVLMNDGACPDVASGVSVRAAIPGCVTTYSAVRTTGIYCRPGCGAKPLAENVRTFELAAAAEAAGFRACLRCRPYRVAGPIAADAPELVCRAVQLIIDGVLDDGTEAALGERLAVSPRHLRRLFNEHLGVTPDELARSRRAHFARRLLDDSDLTVADIAFASGFGSLRQFNRAIREVFRAAPLELRNRRRRADRLAADGGLTLRIPVQPPYDWPAMAAFFAARAVPGVETVSADGTYRRAISLDGAPGVLELRPGSEDHLLLTAHLPYWEGLIHVVERTTRMAGADTDPATSSVAPHVSSGPSGAATASSRVGTALSRDASRDSAAVLGRLVGARPGLRVPGAWGPFEIAVHAVLAQHLPLPEARSALGDLVAATGQPVPGLDHGLTHLFPSAEVLAGTDLPLPRPVADTVQNLAYAVTAGTVILDTAQSLSDLVTALTGIPGLGPNAAHHIALRLGHRDAFPPSDPAVLRALQALRIRPQDIHTHRALAATHLLTHQQTPYAAAPTAPAVA